MGISTKARSSEVTGDLKTASDKCPSCRSDPQFNPGMRFKVSSKCYHRICEGCVDRKFVSGRAPCPIESCKMQLWKSDWRAQQFEDVQMERDVDIRRRVMKTLDRKEEDFSSKRAWDDFLELREELIMNLALGTDVAATNKKLKAYEEANTPASRRQARVGESTDPSGLVTGLRVIAAAPALAPYDPFMGMPTTRDYYELRADYASRYDDFKQSPQFVAGGFDFQQYWDESLLRAFAGLGCFVETEIGDRETAHGPKAVV